MAVLIAVLVLFAMNFVTIWWLTSCVFGKSKRPWRKRKPRYIATALLAFIAVTIELRAYAIPLAAVKYLFA